MAKNCLKCCYSDIALGADKIICHHPSYSPCGWIRLPADKCPMDSGLDEEVIEKAFINNDCNVADCTGLSYSTFKRIAEYFWKLAKDDNGNI